MVMIFFFDEILSGRTLSVEAHCTAKGSADSTHNDGVCTLLVRSPDIAESVLLEFFVVHLSNFAPQRMQKS